MALILNKLKRNRSSKSNDNSPYERYVVLNSIKSVRDFVYDMQKLSGDVNIRSGRFEVTAKSLMSVFSLDLSKPLLTVYYGGNLDSYHNVIIKYEV